jgi:CRP/FNR family transcriptional regulator
MVEESHKTVPDLWKAFDGIKRARSYDAGSTLFEEEEPVAGVYMIRKGRVRVGVSTKDGAYRVLGTAGPGTILGLSEAIAGGPHKLSAHALAQTEVSFVDRDELMEFLAGQQGLCMEIVRVLSEDLHGLYHQFRNLTTDSMRARRRAPDGKFH